MIAAFIIEEVTIADEIEMFEYRKYVPILDEEGNRVELWEPDEIEYENVLNGWGNKINF